MTRVLVVDIDETLVHTFGDDSISDQDVRGLCQKIRDRLYKQVVQPEKLSSQPIIIYGLIRQGAHDFIKWGQQTFDYFVVWSAGTRDYVEKMVQVLFSRGKAPDLILTRDDLEGPISDYRKQLSVVKDILGLKNLEQLVIIDDNKVATSCNEYNRILIPPFESDSLKELCDKEDKELYRVRDFITTIMKRERCLQGPHLHELYETGRENI
uniref:FCP1 homology domain-containing protein n=1 Tax=viral metagenome TaxID=1070528 RepID=A0A6C0JUU0_9ZZZZ